MEGSARAGGGGASPSASGPLPFGAALRSVAPLRSFGRPSRFGSFVRALRLRLSFVARRSLVGARVALRRDRRGAPPFGRVPFSGVPPPRAVARLPRSLPLSSLLSPTRVLLSPRARRPSSLPPLRALSPRRPSLQPPLRFGGCASPASPRGAFHFKMLIFVKKKINLSAFPRVRVRCSALFPYLWGVV